MRPSMSERKGILRKIQEDRFTRAEVSSITGVSSSTLIRWHRDGHFVPVELKPFGEIQVALYSLEQVDTLITDPPYKKRGRPQE